MARCKSKKVNKSVKNGFSLKKSKPKLRENDAESKLHRKRAFKKKALLKFAENSELTEASRKSSSVLKLVAHLEEKRVVKQSTDVDKLLQKLGVTNFDSSKAVDSDEIDSDSIENDHEAIKVKSEKKRKRENKDVEDDNIDTDDYDDGVDEIEIEVENDLKNENDPFVKHLFWDLNDKLLVSLQNNLDIHKEQVSWRNLGKLFFEIPQPKIDVNRTQEPKKLLAAEKRFVELGRFPTLLTSFQVKNEQETNNLFLKRKLLRHLRAANIHNLKSGPNLLNDYQLELFSILNNYQDLLNPEVNFDNLDAVRTVYCLHALNHVMKNRSIILFNNSVFENPLTHSIFDEIPDQYRDQGLVRPKVLILTPFRNSAYLIIKKLISLFAPGRRGQVAYRKRFIRHYTSGGLKLSKKNSKPDDYEKIFEGSIDDNFKIGISVLNSGLKLFVDLYQADIIVASPLGLRILIGAQGEMKRDFDYLASIELLILDQTDIFLMQSWDHVLHIFNHLHIHPKSDHGTNFNRVRPWSLNGLAKYYRQTLIFSSINLVEINSIFNKFCGNYAGKFKVCNDIKLGTISEIVYPLSQIFHRVYTESYQNSINDRFDYFANQIFPQFNRNSFMNHCLVYVANYFDYVRVRNFFMKEDIDFEQICEYSKDDKIAKSRDKFFHGETHFLLYSERFHFFRRVQIKGIRHIIFYQLPNVPHFYSELCNFIKESNQFGNVNMNDCTVTVLYTKYDLNQLSATINSSRASKIITSEKNTHLFKTEDNRK